MEKLLTLLLIGNISLSGMLTGLTKIYDYIACDLLGYSTIDQVEYMTNIIYDLEEKGL